MTKTKKAKSGAKMTTKRSSYHHGDLKRVLIESSIAFIKKSGAHALSLREVARVAGVSHTAPYRHFKDKEALMAAIALEGFIGLNSAFTAAEQAVTSSQEKFLELGVAYVLYALREPDRFRIMFGGFVQCEDDYPELLAESQKAFGSLLQAVIRCQEDGSVKSGDPMLLAATAWSLVHGQSTLMIDGGLARSPLTDDPKRFTMGILLNLFDGLRAK